MYDYVIIVSYKKEVKRKRKVAMKIPKIYIIIEVYLLKYYFESHLIYK